jgi:hypothetical protein
VGRTIRAAFQAKNPLLFSRPALSLSAQSLRFEGPELQQMLGLTTRPIKLFLLKNLDNSGREISPETMLDSNSALYLAKRGCFVGFGSKTRIKRIVERDPRPKLPFVRSWRNSGAGILPFWAAQGSQEA